LFQVKQPKDLTVQEKEEINQIIADFCDIIIARFYGIDVANWIKSFYIQRNYYTALKFIFLEKENNKIVVCVGLNENNEIKMLYYSNTLKDPSFNIQLFLENIREFC
jgi:hypothetical protein